MCIRDKDYVINTHCDEDHVGGLAGVLAKFPAEHVWSSTAEYGTKAFSNFVKYANEQGHAIEIPSLGDTFTLGEAEITVLGPLRDYENKMCIRDRCSRERRSPRSDRSRSRAPRRSQC